MIHLYHHCKHENKTDIIYCFVLQGLQSQTKVLDKRQRYYAPLFLLWMFRDQIAPYESRQKLFVVYIWYFSYSAFFLLFILILSVTAYWFYVSEFCFRQSPLWPGCCWSWAVTVYSWAAPLRRSSCPGRRCEPCTLTLQYACTRAGSSGSARHTQWH